MFNKHSLIALNKTSSTAFNIVCLSFGLPLVTTSGVYSSSLYYTRKNLTTCSKSANKLSTSCVRTACYKLSTSSEKAVNNL